MRRAVLLAIFVWAAATGAAFAVEPDEVLADPALEARARGLSAELRCMVCQNQSIDDSNAPLARDLRILVRERIAAGDSDNEVIEFLVARYGEFILLKPTLSWHTALLWAVAPATLIIGGVFAFVVLRRRASPADTKPLDEAEKRRLKEIFGADPEP